MLIIARTTGVWTVVMNGDSNMSRWHLGSSTVWAFSGFCVDFRWLSG